MFIVITVIIGFMDCEILCFLFSISIYAFLVYFSALVKDFVCSFNFFSIIGLAVIYSIFNGFHYSYNMNIYQTLMSLLQDFTKTLVLNNFISHILDIIVSFSLVPSYFVTQQSRDNYQSIFSSHGYQFIWTPYLLYLRTNFEEY